MIRKREGKITDVYEEIIHFEECDEQLLETVRTRASKAAYKVRDDFVEFFNSPSGSVPWQERMALCN